MNKCIQLVCIRNIIIYCILRVSTISHEWNILSPHTFFPASRASPGEVHKVLDEFITQTQSDECSVCLSLMFQYTTFQIQLTRLAFPTTYISNLLKQLLQP